MGAPISEVVSVTITLQAAGVTRQGFGTPLIAGYHTKYVDRVRRYTDLSGLVADGFAVTDPIYRAATELLAQNPRPVAFKVGRRALPTTQVVNIIPTDTSQGAVYTIKITRPNGTVDTITYTNGPSETATTITTALKTAVTAATNGLTPSGTTSMTCTGAAGALFDYDPGTSPVQIKNTSTDPGVATDLAAIQLADPDWYGLILDSNSAAEVSTPTTGAAAWAEANKKLLVADSIDYDMATNATNDMASVIQTASYTHTGVIFGPTLLSYAGAAALGTQLPTDPGLATVAYKQLAGIGAASLNATQRGYLDGKRANYTVTRAGVTHLNAGKAGKGYLDDARLIDDMTAKLGENLFTLLLNNPKLPYSDASVNAVIGEVLATLQRYQPYAVLTDPAPTCTFPKVKDVSPTDKGNRLLPSGQFTATIAGAIEKINIAGNLVL